MQPALPWNHQAAAVPAKQGRRDSSPDIVYRYRTGLYINLTNKCPGSCRFCVKRLWKMKFQDYNLDLKGREPGAEEVFKLIEQNRKRAPFSEIIFCGLGEPMYRLGTLVDICKAVKKNEPTTRIRLNTVGLGNLIWGRDTVCDLKDNIGSVRISLNTADPAQWLELMRPRPEFAERGYQSVLSFIRSCVGSIPETVVTAVEIPSVDLKTCRELAGKLGAAFQTRAFINVNTP